ncbi:MAG: tRNA uridine-5-carboxymethylaminomethyl(34) synthesis GTPase MnmE [Pseudazoarcus pumilus]|nr:tRNA uridine-5-carboxymethylaminomethyl(34) synthesis GTPase MnmE [Pseudazoarcus pumilus]
MTDTQRTSEPSRDGGDLIAAIATAPGRGGIGVVRVSGRNLLPFAQALSDNAPEPRRAHFTRFLAADGTVLDEGLLLYFRAPHSFTGEDVLELQGHGGPVVMRMLLARCVELGARLAGPGEFSRRAFLNGRMDLAQAEAVADLIEASTEQAARSAVRSLGGEFSRRIEALRDELVDLRMLVEATLDFPEEEIDFLEKARAFERLQSIATHLESVLRTARQGALLRDGLRVVLAGRPNVGKSSLLNALAGDERAIVTEIAGTTRDVLRETIQIEGVPLHIIDTAGLRDTDDPVERIGVARSWREIENADVLVLLSDVSDVAGDAELDASMPASLPRIRVVNKIDLTQEAARRETCAGVPTIRLSARNGEGVDLFRSELLAVAGWQASGEDVFIARERHLLALRRAQDHVSAAHAQAGVLELFAEELRLAHDALGEITGAFTPDDLLGVIFSRFCIGK